MKKNTLIVLPVMLLALYSGTVPGGAAAPELMILDDQELASVTGGDGLSCVLTLASLSTTLKVGGGWLSLFNPVVGITVVGIGVAASAATALCAI